MRPFAPIALLLLAASPVTDPQEFAFKVGRGERVEKSFEIKTTARLVERSLSYNGEELDLEDDGFELELDSTQELRFLDEYRAVDAGRPTTLAREFVQLGARIVVDARFGGQSEAETNDEESALESRTVVFTWDEGGERYTARFDGEGRGDPALLEGLVADTDFLEFLPGKRVTEGERWKLDAKLFRHFIDPGGELHMRSERDGADPGKDAERRKQFRDNYAGEFGASFAGMRAADGRELAVLELKGKGGTHASMRGEDEDGDPVEDRFDMRVEFEGELLWDVAAGRPHSLKIEVEMELDHVETTTWYDEDEGADASLVMTMRFAGPMVVSAAWSTRK